MNTEDNLPFDHFPLIDAIDHEILMHRDAHFGGQFSFMLDYYRQEGVGVNPDFDISRIEYLAGVEEQLKQNLAAVCLEGSEAQKVADVKEAYQKLKAIYEIKRSHHSFPHLIADLILTEDEEAEAEITAVAAQQEKIIPDLLKLLQSEEFYDPLFPGYGRAPFLAVKCLERIGSGNKRVIISLFQALGQGDFFADDQIIKALKAIGKPACDFLLNVVKARPLNEDNERAAIALISFKEDENVASTCFELLKQPDVQKDLCLPTYLVLTCAGLKNSVDRQEFIVLSKNEQFSKLLREDMKSIARDWEENK